MYLLPQTETTTTTTPPRWAGWVRGPAQARPPAPRWRVRAWRPKPAPVRVPGARPEP